MFYKPLAKTEIYKIVDLMIASLGRRLEDKQLEINVTQAAKDYIVEQGYDPVYGARPLKRFIQSKLETLIARAIISDKLKPNTTVTVDCEKDMLVLK